MGNCARIMSRSRASSMATAMSPAEHRLAAFEAGHDRAQRIDLALQDGLAGVEFAAVVGVPQAAATASGATSARRRARVIDRVTPAGRDSEYTHVVHDHQPAAAAGRWPVLRATRYFRVADQPVPVIVSR
jgi:hypothetical protein